MCEPVIVFFVLLKVAMGVFLTKEKDCEGYILIARLSILGDSIFIARFLFQSQNKCDIIFITSLLLLLFCAFVIVLIVTKDQICSLDSFPALYAFTSMTLVLIYTSILQIRYIKLQNDRNALMVQLAREDIL